MVCKCFLHSVKLTFHFVDYFPPCEESFQFDVVPLVILLCFSVPLVLYLKNYYQKHQQFSLCFLLGAFTVSVLTFKSLILFELIFMYGIK